MISETKPMLPGLFRVVEAVVRVTFFEILKDKVLYNVFLCAFLLFWVSWLAFLFFFFQAEDGIRDYKVTGVQTCALPIYAGVAAGGGTAVGRGSAGIDS